MGVVAFDTGGLKTHTQLLWNFSRDIGSTYWAFGFVGLFMDIQTVDRFPSTGTQIAFQWTISVHGNAALKICPQECKWAKIRLFN